MTLGPLQLSRIRMVSFGQIGRLKSTVRNRPGCRISGSGEADLQQSAPTSVVRVISIFPQKLPFVQSGTHRSQQILSQTNESMHRGPEAGPQSGVRQVHLRVPEIGRGTLFVRMVPREN